MYDRNIVECDVQQPISLTHLTHSLTHLNKSAYFFGTKFTYMHHSQSFTSYSCPKMSTTGFFFTVGLVEVMGMDILFIYVMVFPRTPIVLESSDHLSYIVAHIVFLEWDTICPVYV